MDTSIPGKMRVSKGEWYRLGGFANPRLFRKHNGRNWIYWMLID